MRTTPPTTESLRQGATPTARRRTHDPAIGMVAGLDDPAADFTRSWRDAFQRPDPLGMLGHVPAQRRPQRQERSLPYVRFALCFAAFCAVDVAVFLYVIPKWEASTEAARRKGPSRTELPMPDIRQRDVPRATITQGPASRAETMTETIALDAAKLAKGLKCSGGLVYRTAEVAGVKEITIVMVGDLPLRCQ